jgi:hypothetical protein
MVTKPCGCSSSDAENEGARKSVSQRGEIKKGVGCRQCAVRSTPLLLYEFYAARASTATFASSFGVNGFDMKLKAPSFVASMAVSIVP